MNKTIIKVKGKEWEEIINFFRNDGLKNLSEFNRKLLKYNRTKNK
jgi:hypothetical protein